MTDDPATPVRTTSAQSDPLPARPPAGDALRSAAARLVNILEHETTALRQRRPLILDELSDRKNQVLLELTRLDKGLNREALDPELASRLSDLRDRLEGNRSLLELHLRAVRSVADILATAIRDAESDGTYSTLGTMKAGT